MQGNISEKEMARTFNCGIGAVLVINKSDLQLVLDRLAESGEKASVIGVVEQKSGGLIHDLLGLWQLT